MKPDLEFIAIGVPGPQGSKRHVGGGRMVESSKKVKPWRDSVAWAVREAMDGLAALDGPLRVQMVFIFPRPKSRRRADRHDRQPDLSKLIRATEDAITTGGGWADDARVVEYVDTRKCYTDEIPFPAVHSGAVVRVWRL